jgi:uncharacterized protein YmfQ (DUF2313 family)
MGLELATHYQMMVLRLPEGPIWPTVDSDGTSDLEALIRALSSEAVAVDADIDQMVEDFLPDTCGNNGTYLAFWEALLDLDAGSLSNAARQSAIIAKLHRKRDPSLANIQAIADAFDVGAVLTQYDFPAFIMNVSAMGDAIGDAWIATVTLTYPGPQNIALEDAVRAALPIHTYLYVVLT